LLLNKGKKLRQTGREEVPLTPNCVFQLQ